MLSAGDLMFAKPRISTERTQTRLSVLTPLCNGLAIAELGRDYDAEAISVAGTRSSQSSGDALDEAVGAALAHALCSNPEGGIKLTKRARLQRHRNAIVALRAKRWTWEQIAAMLVGAGFDIRPRTLRSEMMAPRKPAQKRNPRVRIGDATSVRVYSSAADTKGATPSAPVSKALASGRRGRRPPDQRPTESGFFTIDLEDN